MNTESTPDPGGEGISIQQAAAHTGLSEHNLRYYERVGLLRPVERAPSSGHRRYGARDLEWIRFLTCLRETRMPIAHMRRYAELRDQGEETARERRRLLEAHRGVVIAQITELTRCLNILDYKIAHYEEIEGLQSPAASEETNIRYRQNGEDRRKEQSLAATTTTGPQRP